MHHRRHRTTTGSGPATATGLWNPLQSLLPHIGLLLLLLLLLLSSCPKVTTFKQQQFRVMPKDVNAREGVNVTLNCEINDVTGDVQWTKDGLALGYEAEIPGHPRHSMELDILHGVYNLLIRNVNVTDDALYQCQVSPGPAAGSKPIRSSARLTVLTPPKYVEIVSQSSDNSKLEVQENHEFTIECVARKSKPEARITWLRSNAEINLSPEHRHDNVTVEIAEKTKLKLYTIRSRIRVNATSEDDRVKYKCEAHHEALSDPLTSAIQIRVLYPPGIPHIEGYTEDDNLVNGQPVRLRCVTKVGNPPTQLAWFRNDQLILNEYRTTEKVSESTYEFTANVSDNNARFRCEAKNSISPLPRSADVVLSVLYGPSHVRIRGPHEAKQGDVIKLSCETGRSNPSSTIKWTVAGEPRDSHSVEVAAPQSSWIAKSNISYLIPNSEHSIEATCQAISNYSLFDKVIASHKISILHPPGDPIIIDYSSGNPIPSGNVHKISCLSTGGNPLATLAWFKNDKKIYSTVTTGENSVSAELSFVANYTDNDAVYKCEVTHPALHVPLMKTQTLRVLFVPDHLYIKHDPPHLKPGVQTTITCEATSSNPAARMGWWFQEKTVTEGINTFTKPGLHGGKLSTIQMTLNVTTDMDGRVYTCQGVNVPLAKSTQKDFVLNVYHKPIFESHPSLMTYTEGDNVLVTLQAKGRPSQITYKWFKNNEPLYSQHSSRRIRDSTLNITGVFRGDDGNYACEASNLEGFSTFLFTLRIKHKAAITNTSEGTEVPEGGDAEIWCLIDGYPLSPGNTSWWRLGFQFANRTSMLLINNISYLKIKNATKFDTGIFNCVVNNGVGNETSHPVTLIVQHKPEIIMPENVAKTTTKVGTSAKLRCRAVGAPAVQISWEREGSTITGSSGKYVVEQKRLNETYYESILTVLDVDQSNYGDYECIASNSLGRAAAVKHLFAVTHPDPPYDFHLVNFTEQGATLAWTPGFDGGEPATYRIRFKQLDQPTYRFEDIGNETQYTVSGLDFYKNYLFTVLAHNVHGDSPYVQQSVKTKNDDKFIKGGKKRNESAQTNLNDESKAEQGMHIYFMFLGIIGGVLILTIMIIVTICIHRRRHNANKPTSNNNNNNDNCNDSSSKTPTIEMYATTNYSGAYEENLSSISAKSETYSNVSPDYNDEQQQKAAEQSYLIEQIDYPFINDCEHPLQQHVQFVGGSGIMIGPDHSLPHYIHENDRRNIAAAVDGDRRAFHQQQQQQQQQQHLQHHQYQPQQHQPQQHHHVHHSPHVQVIPPPPPPVQQQHHIVSRSMPLPPSPPQLHRQQPQVMVQQHHHNRQPPVILPPPMVKLSPQYYAQLQQSPPPPDVTVLSLKQSGMTTFAHKADETAGHLV